MSQSYKCEYYVNNRTTSILMFERSQEMWLFRKEQFHQHHKFLRIPLAVFQVVVRLELMNKQFETMHDKEFHPKSKFQSI